MIQLARGALPGALLALCLLGCATAPAPRVPATGAGARPPDVGQRPEPEGPPQGPAHAPATGLDEPDPSDPTNIDARVGVGYKRTELTGGAHIDEVRAKAALDLADRGLFVVDLGVGALDDVSLDESTGLTDGRFRYFRLWQMDRTVARGYRGWGTSLELRTPGSVPGTDGATSLALGALAAYGSGRQVAFFPNLIVTSIWSRSVDDHLGLALRLDLPFTYKPDGLGPGTYLKLKPAYGYGVTDDLAGESSFVLEASVGGAFSDAKVWWWELQWRGFARDDLELESVGSQSGLATDWSLYLSLTRFF